MKKKIILLAVCVVLLLIFMSSSYGGPDPKYRLKADPWEHMLSSKIDNDQGYDLVVFVINSRFCLMFKSQHNLENSNHLDKPTNQKLSSSVKQLSLNTRNETKSEK